MLTGGEIGRWPEKSVKFIVRLLKNAESNADAKNIEAEDLYIKNIVVQQAPVRATQLISLKPVLKEYVLENPPSHIPCPRSYQPLPRSPLSR